MRGDRTARILAGACIAGSMALAVAVCNAEGVDPGRDVAVTAFAGSTAAANRTATLTMSGGGPGCRLEAVNFDEPPVAPPAGITFPDGVVDVIANRCIPASTLQFALTLTTVVPPGAKYWKYGRTSDDSTSHWYQIPSAINGKTVTFAITDGGLGDDDLSVNGAITGRGGVGIGSLPVPPAPDNVVATTGNDHVSLRWSAAPLATAYTIKRGIKSGGPYVDVSVNQAATVFTDKTGIKGTLYYYTVVASNSEGESGASSEVYASPVAAKTATACGIEPPTFPRSIPCPPLRAGTIIEEEVFVCNGTQWQSTGWRVKESMCVAVDNGSEPATVF